MHSIAKLPCGANRSISIRGHHSCQSTSVVYLISCTQAQCNAVYIGETGCTLRERMNGHRSSIKNNEDTPVAVHFTHRDHSWRVTVLERAPTGIVQRQLLEKLWINRLRGSQLFTVQNPQRWPWHPGAVNSKVIPSVSILPVSTPTLLAFPWHIRQSDPFIFYFPSY